MLETDLKVGIALGPVRTAGEGFATTYSSERLEVGARVAIDAALHVSPGAYLLPLVGLEVTYYPLPYHLPCSAERRRHQHTVGLGRRYGRLALECPLSA